MERRFVNLPNIELLCIMPNPLPTREADMAKIYPHIHVYRPHAGDGLNSAEQVRQFLVAY